jgi:hypothetical protein
MESQRVRFPAFVLCWRVFPLLGQRQAEEAGMSSGPHNRRLQRTPSAPLSRKPFGDTRVRECLGAVVIGSALTVLGCRSATPPVSRNVPDVQRYKDALALRIDLPHPAALAGQTMDASLTLTNRSNEPLDACLGMGHGYHIFGTKKDDGVASVVDHEQCVKRFRLSPGEKLEWSESITVGDVGLGPAKLFAWIKVVALDGWHPLYGGYGVSIAAPFVEFTVHGSSQ